MTARVVLDTNVLVSGLGWAGPSAKILDAVLAGRLALVISLPLLLELQRVLAYPKLARAIPDPAGLAALIADTAIVVHPERTLQAVTDEADNRVLEAALAGAAQYVISGDRHLLAIGVFEGIPIREPAAFLAEIDEQR